MEWHNESPRVTHYGRMARVKRRIASGHYENPRITEHVVRKLQADLEAMEFPDEQEIAERLALNSEGWAEQ